MYCDYEHIKKGVKYPYMRPCTLRKYISSGELEYIEDQASFVNTQSIMTWFAKRLSCFDSHTFEQVIAFICLIPA